jgi:hypothetical protein
MTQHLQTLHHISLFLLSPTQYWGLNSEPSACEAEAGAGAGALPLEPYHSPFCFFFFFGGIDI